MPKINEQNINIHGSSNVKIGDIQMNVTTEKDLETQPASNIENDSAFGFGLKSSIADGRLKEAIEKLLIKFKEDSNSSAINKTIMQATSLTQLELQVNINVISHEQAKIDRAKISNALLQIIDDEIK